MPQHDALGGVSIRGCCGRVDHLENRSGGGVTERRDLGGSAPRQTVSVAPDEKTAGRRPAVDGAGAARERPRQARAWRSSRFWNRSTWPAVSMIVCLPVKNGWQFEQTSTRSSGRVDPTVHSVPHDPQWTFAWKYLG